MCRIVALHKPDTRRFKLGAHRRIDVFIGSRHLMTHGACNKGNTAHEGAADPENVNFHLGRKYRRKDSGNEVESQDRVTEHDHNARQQRDP